MSKDEPKRLLDLRHSRRKLILPLLLGQVIGAALIWIVYAFLDGLFRPSQHIIAFGGIIGGAISYGIITGFFASNLLDTRYLVIFADGSATYKPFFKQINLDFPPDVRWTIGGGKIQFYGDGINEASRSFVIPPTIKPTSVIK